MEMLSYLASQITGFGKAFLNTLVKDPKELASFATQLYITKTCACNLSEQ